MPGCTIQHMPFDCPPIHGAFMHASDVLSERAVHPKNAMTASDIYARTSNRPQEKCQNTSAQFVGDRNGLVYTSVDHTFRWALP